MCDEIKYAYLRNHPLFANVSEQKIKDACSTIKVNTVYRGETFNYGEGNYSKIYLLIKGKIKITECDEVDNELIKDKRFVLVGRGLYALAEWGYVPGVVRDVIKTVLAKNGPMTKEEIIDKVMKERYVKENTILVNLQNPKYFKRDKDGKYTPAEK